MRNPHMLAVLLGLVAAQAAAGATSGTAADAGVFAPRALAKAAPAKPEDTKIAAAAQVGSNKLHVAQASSFEAGQTIIIDVDKASEEINIVTSVETPTELAMRTKLRVAHSQGAVVAHASMQDGEGTDCLAPVTFLFCIVAAASLYYMIHSPSERVKKNSWHALVHCVSIFLAVMVYSGMEALLESIYVAAGVRSDVEAAAHRRLGGKKEATMQSLSISIVELVIFWIIAILVLGWNKGNSLRLKAGGTLNGHILGFAGVYIFGGNLSAFPFFQGRLEFLALITLYLVVVPLIIAITMKVLHLFHTGDHKTDESLEEQGEETCIDFFAFGLSFLLSQYFRSLIKYNRTGEMAPFHAASERTPLSEVTFLFAIGVLFSILTGFMRLQKQLPNLTRELSVTCLGLTAGWCFLDTATWFWLHMFPGRPFVGKAVVAMIWGTAFGFGLLMSAFVSHQANKVLKGELLALSLAVGLSWEHAFHDALVQGCQRVADTQQIARIYQVLATIVIFLIVYPSWAISMLPMYNHHLPELSTQEAREQLGVWDSCCDAPCDNDIPSEAEFASSDEEEIVDTYVRG